MRFMTQLICFGSLSLMAGCASNMPYNSGYPDRVSHEIQVVEDTMVLEIRASDAEPGLPYYQVNKVKNFMADYKSRGHDHGPLVLSVPVGSPFAGQYEAGVQQALAIAYDYGVKDVSRNDYNSNGSPEAPMILAFTAYRAIPPKCRSLASINLSDTRSNDPQPTFGCATQANLAAMVADPADLLGIRRADPIDTLRRTEVLTKYRAGESTATERSQDESGAVSTAVE
tara:strand:- start:38788 stop:39468 length:681 start_codon:yes stop_codon:yes gene_type:complete